LSKTAKIKRKNIKMRKLIEPSREISIVEDYDICIIGGSCTGVFAVVRAARLGAKVVILEKMNSFGGVARATA
jgi:heterodisulfide reductase subunit A-like polyferredoxin